MKTTAAILHKTGAPLKIIDVEIPPIKQGQVLVKMLYSGICRRQVNEQMGYYGEDKYLPHLLGHEGSGIVEEAGEGVKKVKKGDFVVLTWIKANGMDVSASEFMYEGRRINAGAVTTFSYKTVVSENRLVKIDGKIPAEIGAILGCAVPTGIGITKNTLKLDKGATLAVFGVGGIGASVIAGAVLAGAKEIYAVDVDRKKLLFARSLGATRTLNFHDDKMDFKVDFAVEAAGRKEVMETAFKVIKNDGTAILAGNLRKDETISINPFDLILGKKIYGSWGGESKPDIDIPYYAKQYLQGNLKIDKLISGKIKLAEINSALMQLEKGQITGRMLIDFTD